MTLASIKTLDCSSMSNLYRETSLIKDCSIIKNGALRLKTLFKYPNGSNIDLFLENAQDLVNPYRLSDYGNTAEFLLNMGMDPWKNKRRRRPIEEICFSLGIEEIAGELSLSIKQENIPFTADDVCRLAQACIRVSALHLTKRYRKVGKFREDFEECVLADRIEYTADVSFTGKYTNVVWVDFQTKGRSSQNLVQTLSTSNPSSAHPVANEIFVKWHDLESHRGQFDFVTIYDSEAPSIRQEDVRRLEEVSTVLSFPAQMDAITELLAA